jgi:hypothetical protein
MPLKYFRDKLASISAIEQNLSEFVLNYEKFQDILYDFNGTSNYYRIRLPWEIGEKLGKNTSYKDSFSEPIRRLFQYLEFDNPHGWEKFLPNILPFGEEGYQAFITKHQKTLRKMTQFIKAAPDLVNEIKSVAEYLQGGNQAEPGAPTLAEAVGYVNYIANGYQNIMKLLKEVFDLEHKLKAYMERIQLNKERQWNSTGEDIKPKHEGTETLYHATIAADAIINGGFKTRAELGHNGALGGGPSDVVSFTADLRIAKEISKNLRIVVRIAKGLIKPEEILKMAADDNVDISRFDAPRSYARHKTDDPKMTYELFRSFLAQAHFDNKHYDPLFFDVSLDDLKNVDERQIGVLACKVDMSQVKDYLTSMEEYRAPPSAVLGVRKAIG